MKQGARTPRPNPPGDSPWHTTRGIGMRTRRRRNPPGIWGAAGIPRRMGHGRPRYQDSPVGVGFAYSENFRPAPPRRRPSSTGGGDGAESTPSRPLLGQAAAFMNTGRVPSPRPHNPPTNAARKTQRGPIRREPSSFKSESSCPIRQSFGQSPPRQALIPSASNRFEVSLLGAPLRLPGRTYKWGGGRSFRMRGYGSERGPVNWAARRAVSGRR